MKPGLWIVLASLVVVSFAPRAGADASLDKYFALRREHHALDLPLSRVKADPQAYQGKVFELRGVLSGTANGSDNNTFLIIECDGGSYVVTTNNTPEISPSSKICLLVRVGERSILSLSDLRLVAFAPYNEVSEREEKALLAEHDRKARLAAKRAQQEANRAKRQAARAAKAPVSTDIVAAYKNAIKSFNHRLSDSEADTIAQSILGFSIKYEVDPRLVVAVILAESHFNPSATSPKGAKGLGQLMPGTAAGLGVSDAYDPVANIAGSIKLIRGHLNRLSGNASWTELTWNHLALALASYNAGAGAVRKYGGVPPYRETQTYIRKVLSIYKKLCGIR
ncbi:MAG: lytic transglycosylase domain-containing protein [Armatimonadota bacterium]